MHQDTMKDLFLTVSHAWRREEYCKSPEEEACRKKDGHGKWNCCGIKPIATYRASSSMQSSFSFWCSHGDTVRFGRRRVRLLEWDVDFGSFLFFAPYCKLYCNTKYWLDIMIILVLVNISTPTGKRLGGAY